MHRLVILFLFHSADTSVLFGLLLQSPAVITSPLVILFASLQSVMESPPELFHLLLLLWPLQVGGGAHEFAQFAEAFGDIILGQRLQQDQDGRFPTCVAFKDPEVGEVQFVAAPVRPHKVLRENKDGLPAALHGAHDVVHNPVSRKEVPLVETQAQRPVSSRTVRVLIAVSVGKQPVLFLF